jgi:regulator of sirC expression with transglutaminase-like and TPR domain
VLHATSPLDYFRLLVQEPEQIPLFEAAASIATDAEPSLDPEAVQTTFDELAGKLAARARGDSTEHARLGSLLRFFFGSEGFAGNAENYYDPANSYLHRVLATRRGIPISLAVLLLEFARHIGLEAHGVSFPGHFLVRFTLGAGVVVIDPFSGDSLSREELEKRATGFGSPLAQLLRPASRHEILTRMLRNLEAIHLQSGDDRLLSGVRHRLGILEEKS